jgi:hypothetical protein
LFAKDKTIEINDAQEQSLCDTHRLGAAAG